VHSLAREAFLVGRRERAVLWPIAFMVLCCDPLAIALTAAGRRPSMRERRGNMALPRPPIGFILACF